MTTFLFDEDDCDNLHEMCMHLIDEYVNEHIQMMSMPSFHEDLCNGLFELLCVHFGVEYAPDEEEDEEEEKEKEEEDEEEEKEKEEEEEEDEEDKMIKIQQSMYRTLEQIMYQSHADYFASVMSPRSFPTSFVVKEEELEDDKNDELHAHLNMLRSKPQPAQRTPEWYEFRQNLITASNAFKAFGSVAQQNQLIYEKCQCCAKDKEDKEEEKEEETLVNTNTSLHWGQKYEPVSVMWYEREYNTEIGDFGCIVHEKYSFLGASPDGINVKRDNPRFGRMLEIKNIVNRDIDGIPKKEYWIQMQLQMEVCGLDECDFLETQFVELDSAEEYFQDPDVLNKGVIVHFHMSNGSPFYVYKPLQLHKQPENEKSETIQWIEQVVARHESEHMFVKPIFWKLKRVSCVLVKRNPLWFEQSISTLADLWSNVLFDRKHGFEHRVPKRVEKEKEKEKEKGKETECWIVHKTM